MNNFIQIIFNASLKLLKLFLCAWSFSFANFQDIETNSFAEWTALADSCNITNLYVSEARRKMNSHILVTLLITIILSNVVKIVTTNGNSILHLHFGDDSSDNATTNWTFPVKGHFLSI